MSTRIRPPAKSDSERLRQARDRWRSMAAGRGPRVPDGTPRPPFPQRHAMRSPSSPVAATPAPAVQAAPLAQGKGVEVPREETREAARSKAIPSPPSAAAVALTRMGFGPTPDAISDFQALGGTEAARFQAYVDQQIDPAAIDDSVCDARLASSGFTTTGKTVTQLWNQHNLADDWVITMRPFWEVIQGTWIRAIHSKRQLLEMMVGFWHDHFNVFADEVPFGPMWMHSDRDAIRPHALGNFRQMLEAVAKTPAMLFYLDNVYNSAEDANENYARELLELHTLGSQNYYGSMPPDQVPTDQDGLPMGYTEADVIEAARCLSGWTVETQWVHWEMDETGEFLYYAPWHDNGSKQVVGLSLPANQAAMADGQDLLDHLCNHPGTAQHIAGKMCRKLIGDSPSQAVIDAAAATFLANVDAPDQLAQTVRTILLHPSFLQTWGDKVKRPFEIAVSMFRGGGLDLPFTVEDQLDGITGWFGWEYWQTGQPLFSWSTPDGYPDSIRSWNTTSPRVMSWRLANMLFSIWNSDIDDYYFDLVAMTPGSSRSAQELVDYWSVRILGRPLPSAEEQILVAFMAQQENPDTDLPIGTDWETGQRLRALVALVFMSPTFLWK